MDKEHWENKHYAFFCNRECEYFPCHPTDEPENFNCLFCYCPLYLLGDECEGTFTRLPGGEKDCSGCVFPHIRGNYGKIVGRWEDIAKAASVRQKEESRNSAAEGGRCDQ